MSGERNAIEALASNGRMCGVAKILATYQINVATNAKSIIVNDTLGLPELSLRNRIMLVLPLHTNYGNISIRQSNDDCREPRTER